ncbi:Symplekin tight junction protein C terminal-domain-containing protein [Glomus cerebriforme]|uniref:Symplekin tight junction protein C terminal-domain-containing protein n=1 Tax=Glomus cerebriforme TaxID=658196 RepID=A0A397SK09_9GLOM|nr:Symplekin tight junction protein C terminal-domain-containing protein [Glomus cerebriforme]
MNNSHVFEDKRVSVLLDQAAEKQKEVQLRLDALNSFKQLVGEQSIILQPEILHKISGLLRDSVSEIKEWIVDFMDYAFMRIGLPRTLRKDSLDKVLPSIGYVINYESSPAIIKKAILWNASVYPIIFERVAENSTDSTSLWNNALSIKSQIMRFFDSEDTNQGVKICAVKYLVVIAKVQSRRMPDSLGKPEEDISLSYCPPLHPILDLQYLEKESISIVNGMLMVMRTETSSVITAMINAFGPLLRVRPQYVLTFVNHVVSWTKIPERNLRLSQFQIKSVNKSMKVQLMALLRIHENAPFVMEIFNVIIALGGKNDPSKFPRQFRRHLQRDTVEENGRGAVQRIPNPQQSNISFDPSQFALPFVVEVICLVLKTIPQERLNQAKKAIQERNARQTAPAPQLEAADLKPKIRDQKPRDPRLEEEEEEEEEEEDDDEKVMIVESESLERVIDEIVQDIPIESDSDLSVDLDNRKVKFEPTPPPYEVNDMDIEDIYSDDVVAEPPKPDMMEEITPTPPIESTPEPQALPVPAFKFQPYALPPPESLSQEQSNSFIKNTFKNILDVEAALSDVKDKRSNVVLTTLSNGKRLTKSQLHIMASRFLTRGLEASEHDRKQFDELREMIIQFILEDFRNRTEFALTWLDEEWYHDSIVLHKDPSYTPNYSIWLCRLLDRIMPALEDRIFTQFLLDVPELFEDAVDRIKIFCNDPDRSTLGFTTLSELIELRPPARPFCLKILLAYCLHRGERLRSSAITTANKWFPDHPVISSEVESFALQSLKQLSQEIPPPTYDYHYHHSEASDSIQKMIRNYSQKIIDTIGLAGLIDLFQTFPDGAEDFVLRLLIVYTNKTVQPPVQLINTAKSVIVQRNLDGRFLFPIIAYFDKEEILRHLPKVILTLDSTEKQREIVKKVFSKIITVSAKTPTPLEPRELLVFLHQLKQNEVSLKHSVEAIHVCFKLTNIFTSQILGAVLQHLSVQPELPPPFMRTVTLSVRTYKNLSGFVNELLLRYINQIWQNEMLRKGFILYCTEYCLKIQPNDFKFLLRLPKTQILEVLEQKDPTLKKQFRKTILDSNADQRRLLPGYLIELLEINS